MVRTICLVIRVVCYVIAPACFVIMLLKRAPFLLAFRRPFPGVMPLSRGRAYLPRVESEKSLNVTRRLPSWKARRKFTVPLRRRSAARMLAV